MIHVYTTVVQYCTKVIDVKFILCSHKLSMKICPKNSVEFCSMLSDNSLEQVQNTAIRQHL